MDLITVAQAAAAVLAPLLPYLVKGGEEALKEAGKKTGGAAWEAGQSLWARLKAKIAGRPAAQEAAADVAKAPDDKQAQGALAWQNWPGGAAFCPWPSGWRGVTWRCMPTTLFPSFPSCTWERYIAQSCALTPY